MASKPPRYSHSQTVPARPPSPPTPTWPTTQQWTGHRYQSVQHEAGHELPPPPSPPSPSPPSTPINRYATGPTEPPATFRPTGAPTLMSDPADLPWRPFYLRRTVLAACAVTFALLLVAVEALLAFSQGHQGIGNGDSNQHYLWTYGPTAVLTLVAAFWSRVEYQSKMVAPWMRMARGPCQPKQGLLLDYLSDFQPWSVVRGLRNKDFAVAIATTVSILIKISIIISTGLISLSLTPVVDESFPMVLQDRFVDDPARLNSAGPMAWYFMRGLIDGNLTYPDGYWSDYAFQSVRKTDFPNGALTRVTVDGLKNDLECLPAEVVLTGAHPPDPRHQEWTANVTITAPGCKVNNLRLASPTMPGSQEMATVQFARLVVMQCDGTRGDEGKRIFAMVGNLTYVKDTSHSRPDHTGQTKVYDYFATLHQSTQLLCIPSYHISPVEVVSNGTQTISVAPAPGAPKRQLDSIAAWTMVGAQFRAFTSSAALSGIVDSVWHQVSTLVSNGTHPVPVDADVYSQTAFQSHLPPNATFKHLYGDPSLLQDVVTGYHSQILAALTRMSLTQPASIATTGNLTVNRERLVIRGWATHWMAGLLAACIGLTLVDVFLVPRRGILPTDPSGLPGLASLLQNSPELTEKLRYLGAANEKELSSLLRGTSFSAGLRHGSASPNFSIADTTRNDDSGSQESFSAPHSSHAHPAIIHPATRATLLLVLSGLIVALELMLRKSGNDEGLGDVGDDKFLHYTWTALPALVLGSLALVMSAMDFQIRSLAPYTTLLRPTSTKRFMVLDFLDMSVPRTILRAVSLGNLGVLATTLAFLISSLFTIFSSSLFHAVAVPVAGQISLQANMSFTMKLDSGGVEFSSGKDALVMASVILEGNMTYPDHTYEHLAFPMMMTTSLSIPDVGTFDTSSARVNAIVPAVRSRLQCRYYSMSEIETNHTRDIDDNLAGQNPLGIRIPGEDCGNRFNSSSDEERYDIYIEPTFPNTTFFGGEGGELEGTNLRFTCSHLLYAWGSLDYAAEKSVVSINAMACNSTMERVDVDTTFIGTRLRIDPANPPRPLEETARRSTLPVNKTLDYAYIARVPAPGGAVSPFFSLLTTSRWAVPVEAFGDPAAQKTVGEAIQWQHNIIQAQLLRANLGPANATNATLSNPKPGDNDAQPVYQGQIHDPVARRRVLMDPVSTRVLQGLLGATIVLLVVGWIFVRKTTVLAASPTSIAARAALVAGGNLLEMLPPDAARRTPEEIAAALGRDTKFRLEWGAEESDRGALLEGAGSYDKAVVGRYGIFGKREGYQ